MIWIPTQLKHLYNLESNLLQLLPLPYNFLLALFDILLPPTKKNFFSNCPKPESSESAEPTESTESPATKN